jgi:indole-3-glycerol phosphate synthase
MSILSEILDHKRTEITSLDIAYLRSAAEQSPKPLDFIFELQRRRVGKKPALIAELKRASPSKGILAANLDLSKVAEIYADNGAAAISVLTDEKFFMGGIGTLRQLGNAQNIKLPLLRKDFIVSEAQLYETRANGADAVLLITAALLDDKLLADLHSLAISLGLCPLVEVHNQQETERALKLKDIRMIGINNRNLDTFEVNLAATELIRPLIPPDIQVVAESGIFGARDVARLAQAGVDAILVGEALITAPDLARKVRELSGQPIL